MNVENEIAQEMEFNREQLGTRIPDRVEELLHTIDGSRDRLEEWCASLFIKIGNSILRVSGDLVLTIGRDALPASAWCARNLLELWIWTKYCAASREKARRFHEDALRDIAGLIEAHAAMCKLAGIPYTKEAQSRRRLAEEAQKVTGSASIDSAFERVSNAAMRVGLGEPFRAWNSHLSKFAHPTAGLVIGIMHQTATLAGVQSDCTTLGLYYAGQCVMGLEEVVS